MVALKDLKSITLKSKWRSLTSGVPQGSVLALMLFDIFVGNMASGTECILSTISFSDILIIFII